MQECRSLVPGLLLIPVEPPLRKVHRQTAPVLQCARGRRRRRRLRGRRVQGSRGRRLDPHLAAVVVLEQERHRPLADVLGEAVRPAAAERRAST